ncbi:MAG: hypothetical protein JWR52_2355 [Marmoricola sp.]|nr:hypothetical protein [Marmoricola sp.]
METQSSDRIEMLKGGTISFAVNLAYLFLGPHGDQRILLMLFATIIAGGVLLFTPRGGLGMGFLLGAVAAVVVGLAGAGLLGWSPISH